MADDTAQDAADGNGAGDRSPRPVAFSDAEWQEIEAAAAAAGGAAADFVRDAALAMAARPGTVAGLIERTWLNTYLLATLKRDEMVLEGRGAELDRARRDAQATLASLLGDRGN